MKKKLAVCYLNIVEISLEIMRYFYPSYISAILFLFLFRSKFLGATFVSTEGKFDFANWVVIFHIAKPDNPVTILGGL